MKYVAVARNTQTNDADLRSLQNLLRKLLQGQNNHLTRRHFNQHFFWGKNAPAQIHFQVCKFSKVAFLRLLIAFPCFSGSFAFHVFWIVHSNILSCFKSLLKFTEPQRQGVLRKGKSAQVHIVSCGKILRRFMECVPTATLGQVDFGLWGNSWPSIMENTTVHSSLEHHYTVDCHTFWTTVINCRKHAHCSCKCMSTNLNTSHLHHIHRKTYIYTQTHLHRTSKIMFPSLTWKRCIEATN